MLDFKAGARCNRIENIKIMKLTIFLVFVCCIGLISYAVAGPSSANGPGAQTDSDMYGMPVRVPTTHSGPAFTAGGQATAANASSNSSSNGVSNATSTGENASANESSASTDGSSNASSTSQNPSANPYSNGSLNQNTTAASNVIGRGQEKVVEISDKDLAAEAARNSEKSEVAKKFEPSILNQGIDEIANSKASSKVPDFAPVNPVTGAPIPPRPSFRQPPISPIPHATVPPQVPAVPGISPIPSATVSRGINPVPNATVSPRS
ncbi:MAG TPA: hypothetical protein VGQ95_10940 [Chthoniobacterales bacterium]|nr:hypothetical protein [Chthoniobacterales bacterium]